MLYEYVRYADPSKFPSDTFHALTDHLLTMRNWLYKASETPLGLIGLFPSRPAVNLPYTMRFFTFSKKRTAYTALKQVEDIFAEFYLMTDILPFIITIPSLYFHSPQKLPSKIKSQFKRRGVLLYAVET